MNFAMAHATRPANARTVRAGAKQEHRPTAALIDELTAQTWLDAGVRPGMRVLVAGGDIGALSRLAATTVGTKGSVATTIRADAQVDAMLLRCALLPLDDPWATLRDLLRAVKPGGLVVAQEIDDGSEASAGATIFERLGHAIPGSPLELCIAVRLGRIFRACGLPPPQFTYSGEVRSRHLREVSSARPDFVCAATRVAAA